MKTKMLLPAIVIVAWMSSIAAPAWADIRLPDKKPAVGPPSVPLVVKTDETQEVSVLRIGREALKQAGWPVPGRRAEMSPSNLRSIVAAVALSLGIAGLFLLRGRRGAAATAGLLAGAIVAMVAMQAWGNMPPPHRVRPALPAGDYRGRVVIEIVNEPAGEAELIIGMMAKPERAPEPPPAPKS